MSSRKKILSLNTNWFPRIKKKTHFTESNSTVTLEVPFIDQCIVGLDIRKIAC
ncbi:unnamed protein product [Brugia timori]|uniref:Transposase n=1 Tax=Brugia timori TaxID=42155 RepID=A0A0R3R4P7_9BILA|nr:unnamed protein product [Brugia timori]